MGYGLHRFPGGVDPNLLCAICGSVLQEAVLTPCGHSFCQLCLHTWLARPDTTPTCPECRGLVVTQRDVRPIHAVRNLVNNLDIQCEHSGGGCRAVVKLDGLLGHISMCSFALIECAGCGVQVSRAELANHQMRCEAIAAALWDEELLGDTGRGVSSSGSHQQGTSSGTTTTTTTTTTALTLRIPPRAPFTCCTTRGTYITTPSTTVGHYSRGVGPPDSHHSPPGAAPRSLPCEVTELTFRVVTLEMQLKRMKRDLEAADMKHRKLERELKRTRDELEAKRMQCLDKQYVEFNPDYDYGFDPNTIAKLSCLVSKFLLKKPPYIDRDRVFGAVKRCYDHFSRSGDEYEHDVHMLVATAYASNWFSETQKLSFHCWLQSIARSRQFSPGIGQK